MKILMRPISKERLDSIGIRNVDPNYNVWIKKLIIAIVWLYATVWFPDDFNNSEIFSITTLFVIMLTISSSLNLVIVLIAYKVIMNGVEIMFVTSGKSKISAISQNTIKSYIGWPTDYVMLMTYAATTFIVGLIGYRFFNDGNFAMSIAVSGLVASTVLKDFSFAIIIRNLIQK